LGVDYSHYAAITTAARAAIHTYSNGAADHHRLN